MARRIRKRSVGLALLLLLLVNFAGWQMFSIIGDASSRGLNFVGITDSLIQSALILVVIILILFTAGMKGKKILKEMID